MEENRPTVIYGVNTQQFLSNLRLYYSLLIKYSRSKCIWYFVVHVWRVREEGERVPLGSHVGRRKQCGTLRQNVLSLLKTYWLFNVFRTEMENRYWSVENCPCHLFIDGNDFGSFYGLWHRSCILKEQFIISASFVAMSRICELWLSMRASISSTLYCRLSERFLLKWTIPCTSRHRDKSKSVRKGIHVSYKEICWAHNYFLTKRLRY